MKLTKQELKLIIKEELQKLEENNLNEKAVYSFPDLTVDLKNIRKSIILVIKKAKKNGISDKQIFDQIADTRLWMKNITKFVK